MKKGIIEKAYSASSSEYLIALTTFYRFVKMLNPEGKPYRKVYQWIAERHKFLADEKIPLPKMKVLAAEIGIRATEITKYLKMIYDDIFELNERQPELFCKEGQKLCFLTFHFFGQYAQFNYGLDCIPREGELFCFYFVKPRNGGHMFYVKSISHDLDYKHHEVLISLDIDYPLTYMRLLKERAYLHGDITTSELLGSLSLTQEEHLLKWNKNL